MLYLISVYATILLVSFITVYILIPKLIPILRESGFVGKDMNKDKKTTVAELGGIPIFLGFIFGAIFAIFLSTYLGFNLDLLPFLAGILTIILIGFIGTIDDLIGWKKGIRQWQHALFPVAAALPLMAVRVSNPPMSLPFIGLLPETFILPFGIAISFGVIYSLILVPIGVTGASNATNMLAGLNGLEAGLAALIIGTLAIIALFTGKIEALIIALAMIGALIAFLKYNWMPAKIFGGDGLTLMSGASIAVIAILGDMEKIGVILLVLFFVELYLKSKSKFQAESFGIPKNGLLCAPKKKQSLTHYFMYGKATEKQIVKRILFTQFLICIFALTIASLNYLQIIMI
ncbi:MAG: glycosyl transferase family 4 [Candidatus Diapherotrites archaeon]|jgi:UDP-N-acetylglucosamine--dolichyl-phosphate N-acetylglucosaminephosphotransferase|nr:glycosyl transferase family 4 [Candidatus Diapherotrites archaeon]MBT4597329.1 glycosyl transferase family 4 [Candidatus Diapherotrites archaeon]